MHSSMKLTAKFQITNEKNWISISRKFSITSSSIHGKKIKALSVKWIFAFQNISIFHNLIYGNSTRSVLEVYVHAHGVRDVRIKIYSLKESFGQSIWRIHKFIWHSCNHLYSVCWFLIYQKNLISQLDLMWVLITHSPGTKRFVHENIDFKWVIDSKSFNRKWLRILEYVREILREFLLKSKKS